MDKLQCTMCACRASASTQIRVYQFVKHIFRRTWTRIY